MDLRERLAKRREQQHAGPGPIPRQEMSDEVQFKGQQFDRTSLAEDRAREAQWNAFTAANGRYPQGDELPKWAAEQERTKDQVAPSRVNDAKFDLALSANIERERNGKQHIEMPKLMDALDRAAMRRQDEAKKMERSPDLKAQVPRLTK